MNGKPLVYWVSAPTEVEYDMYMLSKITKKMELRVVTIGQEGVIHPYDIDISFQPYASTSINTNKDFGYCPGGQEDIFQNIVIENPDLVIKKAGWVGNITNRSDLFPKLMNMYGIRHCLWTSEQGCLRDWQLDIARYYNWIVVNNKEDLSYYRERFGYADSQHKVSYMPFGCVPKFHKNMKTKHDAKLCSYSNPQWGIECKGKSFNRVVGSLIEDYTPDELALYGKYLWYPTPYFDFFRGEFAYKDIAYINSSSDILLGISANTETGGYGCKLAKMLSCGAFVIWDYTKGIENDFENGKQLVWTKSAEETKELVKYYLDHPKERNKIAKEGQKYAHKYLSWETNILKLLKEVC
jgi:hypothetical protein